MPSIPLISPAGYAPKFAIAFGNASGGAETVALDNPLPVSFAPSAAPTALTGSTASSLTAGPFAPAAGRPIVLTLSGTWTGQVQLLRSTDGGASKLPVTAAGQSYGLYSQNICEPVWEESEAAATLFLGITVTSGTINFRMGQ